MTLYNANTTADDCSMEDTSQEQSLVEAIVADRSNRGHSPKSREVMRYVDQMLALPNPEGIIFRLAAHPDLGCRKVASCALSTGRVASTRSVRELAESMLRDPDWEIREYAAFAVLSTVGREHIEAWARHNVTSDNANTRRGVAIIARELLRDPLLRATGVELLTALSRDANKYVIDAVSPFGLGDQLFRSDPHLAQRTIKELSDDEDPRARRCAALALQAASARPFSSTSRGLLGKLLSDSEAAVARAAARAVILAIRMQSISDADQRYLLGIAERAETLPKATRDLVGKYMEML